MPPKVIRLNVPAEEGAGKGEGEQLSWNFLFPTNAKILRHIQFKLMNSPPRNGRKLSQGSHHQFFSCSFFFLMKNITPG